MPKSQSLIIALIVMPLRPVAWPQLCDELLCLLGEAEDDLSLGISGFESKRGGDVVRH